ncbi:ATP-binding cassette sub- A member 12 [Phytophthora pseudosyringae]|uniref:ATP-binding cassette sub- A member 12 n=1 Tax=Phytophthora pseudosyringae TaxID=221518 RepID=A0A8T1VGW4_9STRA|nr:ATP-binding cassette sub- A member 12 [Phytophthora pseudosyringae]
MKSERESSPLAANRSTAAHMRTLLWKNYTLKRRHARATAFEIALPCLFLLLLGALKHLVDDVDVPAGWSDSTSPENDDAVGTTYSLYDPSGLSLSSVPAELPKWTQYETSVTGLLWYMARQSVTDGVRLNELAAGDYATCTAGVAVYGYVDTNSSSESSVPPECDGRVVPYKIAVVPDNAFTREYFMHTMELWYPRVNLLNESTSLQFPSLSESAAFFETEDALEEYVKGKHYGSSLENPKIYGGIVFDKYPSDGDISSFSSIEYTLRLNSTEAASGALGLIPPTNGDAAALYPSQKSIKTDYYTRYTLTGFMTLQTLVTRFVTCMPDWDATTKSTTGTCQRAQATASPSNELDERLLKSLENDAMLKAAVGEYAAATGGSNATISDTLSLLSSTTKEALLTPLRQAPQPYLGASVAPFPIEAYTSSPFYDDVSSVFAIVFIMSYLYTSSRILVAFIQEKELRLREYMKILGVKERVIIATWYITYTVILFLSAVLQAATGLVGLFANSSVLVIFLFFFLFGLSVLCYGFFISAIFSNARTGSFVGMIVFFLMYFVAQAFTDDSPEQDITQACVLPPVALSFGLATIADFETTGIGANFGNLDTLNVNFRLNTALQMFVLDCVLYTLLGLYFERVISKQYGTTLKWYFPVSPSYWRGRKQSASSSGNETPADSLLDNVAVDVNPNIERVSAELREQERRGDALSVQRLRKTFEVPGGTKVAVKGLDLVMYKDQITCLLGHNGAGKSTLISMLTGMTAPSSGEATYRGLSLNQDMEEIRESLGICFQHDVLFEDLTVEEHLLLFGRVKGYRNEQLRELVSSQIRQVGLTEKSHVLSKELSGGMKRKLSVAISLLGDSSLVFLDEPTSGMDPYSRRSTWEILQNNRNGRVMVLTTHFMDEADILGDRIAIMAEGELRCCGSSLFLKNQYGAGYNLTIVKDDAKCDDKAVTHLIRSYVPSAELLSSVGSEIAFQLPQKSSPMFAPMFTEMDKKLAKLGLLSYGISATTLEEVFIKVAEADDVNHQHTLGQRVRPESKELDSCLVLQTSGLFTSHLRALLFKRLHHAKRETKMIIYTTFYPILLLLAGLLILKSSGTTSDDPNMVLNTNAYNSDNSTPTPYYCQAEDAWCSAVLGSHFTGGKAQELAVPSPAYDSSSPTVFDVTYSDPEINATDSTGFGLRMGQAIYNRGYGDNETEVVDDQYGAYLVYGDSSEQVFGYNLFVNTTATHAPVIFKALMDQAIYRFFAANTSDSDASSVDLTVNNHPLPLTAAAKALFGSFLAFSACVFVCISFSYFPLPVVVYLVREKEANHNSKHQQLVSGVSLTAFWLANYLWDLMMYVVPCVAAIILIKVFDVSALTGNAECTSCTSATFPAVVLLFVLFGLAICPFTYSLSFLFKEHAASQTFTMKINFLLGVVLMIVSYILDVIESTKSVNSVLKFIWRLSPLFDLGNGLLSLVLNELDALQDGTAAKKSPFSTDLMGAELIYLVLTTFLFSALVLAIDYDVKIPGLRRKRSDHQTVEDGTFVVDVDVAKEAQRVASGQADGDAVKVAGLRKVYKGGKVAVRDLAFGLKRGECFGFLGINGAGKTTTMKMLTGDVSPSNGSATLGGFDILTQPIEVRRQIGYCPQFDALFERMTVREHLELFAAIKGVPRTDMEAVVTEKIHQMNLADFEHKLAGSLSGGNKRKLSVAIALIGSPPIIFLDEPSTGMDPVSRRFMWDVIADISTRGKESTIVLTTHSMEECEALCSKVGIMVGGRLRCYGSVQHLKSRFGDGLVFDTKFDSVTADELERLVQNIFAEGSDHVTPTDLEDKCRAFGNMELAKRVTASHPTGYSIAAAIERDGFVRAEAFCSWCAEETRFDALNDFLAQAFGTEDVAVLERQNDFCRFKVRGEVKLSRMFALVEDIKLQMHIREYSVSQTTLEQIFNSFASQQEEEQGVARGVFQAA